MKKLGVAKKTLCRSRKSTLVFGFLVAATAFLIPGGRSVFGVPSEPLRVVAFGSSSTEGIGATSPHSTYPAQLQAVLSQLVGGGRLVEVTNRGVSGEDADDMAKRLDRDVIARHPDVVIWQTGSNDPIKHVPVDRFERETRDGIKAMRKADIAVILMEPQWCPRLELTGTSNAYIEAVRRIGREMNVEVVRRSDLMHAWIRDGKLTRRQMLAADGLHMTDGGYALLARSVAPTVIKLDLADSQKVD